MSAAGNPAGPPEPVMPISRRLSPLSIVLLVLSILASAGLLVLLAGLFYLFAQGYSGGNDPTSVAPLAFPVSFVLFLYFGVPVAMLCTVLWLGFAFSLRRRRY